MALAFSTVTNSVAALVVSGVTIKDIDELLDEVKDRDCPMIQPGPVFVSDLNLVRDSQRNDANSGMKTVTYTLRYRYFHTSVGSARGLHDVFDGMVINAGLFLDAVISGDNMSGAVDVNPTGVLEFGTVTDPSDNVFYGCDINLRVEEFVN